MNVCIFSLYLCLFLHVQNHICIATAVLYGYVWVCVSGSIKLPQAMSGVDQVDLIKLIGIKTPRIIQYPITATVTSPFQSPFNHPNNNYYHGL